MTLEPGDRFGEYQILGLLGEGGMGTVYEAERSTDATRVALKCMHPWVARQPALLERFRREAEIGQRLSHPGIVKVLALVEEEEDRLALVMELIPGQSLEELLAAGPVKTTRAVGILTQLAAAVAALHSQDVIHRDLKPENVRITPEGRAVVLDFGIARAGHSSHTRTGTGMGTVHYMAPEQYLDAKRVDNRADVYALGVIALQLFTGELPWSKATSEFEILAAKKEGRVDLSALPPGLAEVVGVAMSPKQEDRFATATAMANALQAAVNEPKAKPAPARKAPTPEPPREAKQIDEEVQEEAAEEEGSGVALELVCLVFTLLVALGLGSLGSIGVWLAVGLGGVLALGGAIGLALQRSVPVGLCSASLALPVLAATRSVDAGTDAALASHTDLTELAPEIAESLQVVMPLGAACVAGLLLLLGASVGGLRSRQSWARPIGGVALLSTLLMVALAAFAAAGHQLGPQPVALAAATLLFGVPGALALAGGGPKGSHAAAVGGITTAFLLGLAALLPTQDGSVMVWKAVSFASPETQWTLLAAGEGIVAANRALFWVTFGLAGLFATTGLAAARGGRAFSALTLLGLPALLGASQVSGEFADRRSEAWAQALPHDFTLPTSTSMRAPELARSLHVYADGRMLMDGLPVDADSLGAGRLMLSAGGEVPYGKVADAVLGRGLCEVDALVSGERWPATVSITPSDCERKDAEPVDIGGLLADREDQEPLLQVLLVNDEVLVVQLDPREGPRAYIPKLQRVPCPEWQCQEALNEAVARVKDELPDSETVTLASTDEVPWSAVIMATDALREGPDAWEPRVYFPYVTLARFDDLVAQPLEGPSDEVGGGTGKGLATKAAGTGSFGAKGEGGIGRMGSDPIILGALDKSLIDAVLKRNMNQIRYCYQRELTKNPNLGGKIVVKFVIAKDGTVSNATTKSSTMGSPAVENCINSRFMRFTFPEPKGGGIVIVSYPFVFSPG